MLQANQLKAHLTPAKGFLFLVTIIEVLPKEKKQKEEKTAQLSQCTVDLFPLFSTVQPITQTLDLFPIQPTDNNADLSKVSSNVSRLFFSITYPDLYHIYSDL